MSCRLLLTYLSIWSTESYTQRGKDPGEDGQEVEIYITQGPHAQQLGRLSCTYRGSPVRACLSWVPSSFVDAMRMISTVKQDCSRRGSSAYAKEACGAVLRVSGPICRRDHSYMYSHRYAYRCILPRSRYL